MPSTPAYLRVFNGCTFLMVREDDGRTFWTAKNTPWNLSRAIAYAHEAGYAVIGSASRIWDRKCVMFYNAD